MTKKYTKEEFEIAVKTSNSVREVLIKIGVEPKGGNYKVFYRTAKKFNVDVSSFVSSSTYGIDKEKRDCISDAQITEAVKNNYSYQGVLNQFGLLASGTNNKWIRFQIKKLSLDTSHFTGQGHLKGKTHDWSPKTALSEILVKDSQYGSTSHLRKRLLKENLLIEECAQCHITAWQGQKLTLHLDHINGNNTDHRIENLRLLCPNCHSLTETYCGKNKSKW